MGAAGRSNSVKWRSLDWSFGHRGRGGLSREAGAAMFQGLRVRLTLWYCGVMGAALVLFGVSLYFGTQYFLLSPIENDAVAHARVHAREWSTGAIDRACPISFQGQFGQPPGQGFQMPEQ